MNKKLICLIVVILAAVIALGLFLASEYGLFGEISYTYSVEDSVKVQVTLDTTGGYSFSHEIPFTVSEKGESRTVGQFIYEETYDQFVIDAINGEYTAILDGGERDGYEYVFWNFNDSEYNYVLLFPDTGTGIILSNLISEESARECFERLTFAIAE